MALTKAIAVSPFNFKGKPVPKSPVFQKEAPSFGPRALHSTP